MNQDHILQDYERDGVVRTKNLLSPEEVMA